MELVEMHKIQVSGHISSGGSRGRARVPRLFLDQTEARKVEKIFFGDRAPPFLRVWMTGPPVSRSVPGTD